MRRHFLLVGVFGAFLVACCHPITHHGARGSLLDDASGGAPADAEGGASASAGAADQDPLPSAGDSGNGGGKGGEAGSRGGEGGRLDTGDDPSGTSGETSAAPPMAPTDNTRPHVLATSPRAGAVGVTSPDIVVQFSEPMDARSVKVDAVGAQVESVSWNARSDTLTVHTDLKLPESSFPPTGSTRASISLEVAADASDSSGNTLGAPFTLKIFPALRVTERFNLYLPLRGHAHGSYILAGDTADNAVEMGLIPFDVGTIPNNVVAVERAVLTLAVRRMTSSLVVRGNPLHDLGDLVLEHAFYTELDTTAYSAAAALGSPIRLLESGATPMPDEAFDVEVTGAVVDDLSKRDSRQSRSQYRIRFQTATDGDGAEDQLMVWNYRETHAQCGGVCQDHQVPHLTVTYLTP